MLFYGGAASLIAGAGLLGRDMVLRHNRGEFGAHARGLGWWLIYCGVIASAPEIIGAFLGS
jgi:hypothetical protein